MICMMFFPQKNVTVEGKQASEIEDGCEGQGKYCGGFYPVMIVAKGEPSIYVLPW